MKRNTIILAIVAISALIIGIYLYYRRTGVNAGNHDYIKLLQKASPYKVWLDIEYYDQKLGRINTLSIDQFGNVEDFLANLFLAGQINQVQYQSGLSQWAAIGGWNW